MLRIHETPPQQSQIGLYVTPGIRPTALHAHICELGIRYLYYGIYCPHIILLPTLVLWNLLPPPPLDQACEKIGSGLHPHDFCVHIMMHFL